MFHNAWSDENLSEHGWINGESHSGRAEQQYILEVAGILDTLYGFSCNSSNKSKTLMGNLY